MDSMNGGNRLAKCLMILLITGVGLLFNCIEFICHLFGKDISVVRIVFNFNYVSTDTCYVRCLVEQIYLGFIK